MDYFRRGARRELDPFIPVVEGSIPDETNKSEGYWATFGPTRGPACGKSDFGLKLVSAAGGMLKVKEDVKLTFDFVARKQD